MSTQTNIDYTAELDKWRIKLAFHDADTNTDTDTSSLGLSRECRRVVQLATGITSGNRACRTCRRGSVSVSVSASWNASFTTEENASVFAVLVKLYSAQECVGDIGVKKTTFVFITANSPFTSCESLQTIRPTFCSIFFYFFGSICGDH